MSANVYEQLKAKCLPLMTHYLDDLLKHDKEDIEGRPGIPFLHWTRSTGTTITFLPPADDPEYPPYGQLVRYLFSMVGREHILRQKTIIAEYHTNKYNDPESFTCHYFNGKTLRQITVQEAVKIAKEYARPIERKWHNDWLKNNRPWEYRQLRDAGALA